MSKNSEFLDTKFQPFKKNEFGVYCPGVPIANFLVHSRAFFKASASFSFHSSATSLARGSSGLGAERRACMDSKTVLICSAGLHLSFKISKQILPSLSILGW